MGEAKGIRIIPSVMIQHFDRAERQRPTEGKEKGGEQGGGGEGRLEE